MTSCAAMQPGGALQVAAVLQPDAQYADGHGSEYYVRAVVDGSGPRQRSLKRLLDNGYDQQSAVWNESPAYSNNVANDYIECPEMLDRVFGIDLLPGMQVLPRACAPCRSISCPMAEP